MGEARYVLETLVWASRAPDIDAGLAEGEYIRLMDVECLYVAVEGDREADGRSFSLDKAGRQHTDHTRSNVASHSVEVTQSRMVVAEGAMEHF